MHDAFMKQKSFLRLHKLYTFTASNVSRKDFPKGISIVYESMALLMNNKHCCSNYPYID